MRINYLLVSIFWFTLQDRHDGVVESRLFVRKVTIDSFHKYTIVAINSVDSMSNTVELNQSKILDCYTCASLFLKLSLTVVSRLVSQLRMRVPQPKVWKSHNLQYYRMT